MKNRCIKISICLLILILTVIGFTTASCEDDDDGNRYELINQSLSWTDAKLEAERRGGYLVVIGNKQEQIKIENLISKEGKMRSYWIGGYCENDRIFKWINNEPMNYINWGNGEPNNYQESQDKMRIIRLPYVSVFGQEVEFGQWDDDSDTNNENGYIIEKD